MINFALAREIYGAEPWLMDHISFSSLFKILSDFRAGIELDYDEENQLNSIHSIPVTNAASPIVAFGKWDLNDLKAGEKAISVVMLNGPIVKNSGLSTRGTKQLAAQMNQMTNDDRIIGHILYTDSGGGATSAVSFLSDAIRNSQAQGKPVVQFMEKGSLNASAAYWIGSHSDFIISEEKENLVGSIGTMIQFAGIPKQMTDSNGVVWVRAYATKSVSKNKEFEEAIEGNLEPITDRFLDPTNEIFLNKIRENRANVEDKHLDGTIFDAGDVVGSLIDSIGDFQSAVDKVVELSGKQISTQAPTAQSNNKTKSKTMDLSTLQSEHRDLYNSVINLGVAQERDRVGAWLAHADADLKEVKEGIKSGEPISSTKTQELLIKANAKAGVEALKTDAAEDLQTQEAKEGAEDTAEVDAFYAEIDNKLKAKSK